MSLTAGVLSQVSVGPTTASLSATAASGGTGPYTQQWYRSTASGFSPGGGNIIAGATALTLNDSGLIPNTKYFYEVVYTDTGNSNATVNSSQLSVVTSPVALSQNAFSQSPLVGTIDLRSPAAGTIPAIVDSSQSGVLYFGQAVKLVANTAGGPPRVVGCSANSDSIFGFIYYDLKSQAFVAGSRCEIIQKDFAYLYATGAITQGAQVQLDISTVGGVAAKSGSSGAAIVGWALDGAAAAGALIRVKLELPAFTFA